MKLCYSRPGLYLLLAILRSIRNVQEHRLIRRTLYYKQSKLVQYEAILIRFMETTSSLNVLIGFS